MRFLFLTIAAGATAMLAVTPASSQTWRISNRVSTEVRQDIDQLERQISRAQERRTISRREAAQLRSEARDIRVLYDRYRRNGFTRAEVARLEREVNEVRAQLKLARRDWDGRR